MLFNSLIFTIFLPIVFLIYWLCPTRFRNYFLLIASYYFYYSYNPWFLILLIGTSCFDYFCARAIVLKPKHKQFYLVLSVISNLGVLAAFKYTSFFFNTGVTLLNTYTNTTYSFMESIIIPAGLSFYTFQSLSYTIDVYRGKYKANDSLYQFLLYVSFFPHMVAGPIVRYNDLMPQLKAVTYFKSINWRAFTQLTSWGYFKKIVIADNLNTIVTPIFDNVSAYNGLELITAGLLFVIQVYCDFSGYSDIATGIAKLFNINLSLNWRRPLLSRSIHEFWQRNHISITTWFRDYLYISLGGNRVSYKRWLLNIFLVFVISGFWHGANFTFVIWGAIHGLFFVMEALLKKQFPNYKANATLAWFYLIAVHTLSLLAFRANSVTDLIYIYKSIFSFSGHFNFLQFQLLEGKFYFLVMIAVILILVLKELNEEFALLNKQKYLYNILKPAFYILLIVLTFLIGNFSANTFIYFQF